VTEEAKLGQIRKLLRKAESTVSREEAAALQAKAFELAAKYKIGHAMLQTEELQRGGPREEIVSTIVEVERPWAQKRDLALYCYKASGCNAVIIGDNKVHFFGFATDMELASVTFSSVLIQGERFFRQEDSPHKKTRYAQYRRAWWQGFASEIWVRLNDAKEEAESSVPGSEVALLDRSLAVQEAVGREYPYTKKAARRRMPATSAGLVDGLLAGERVDLSSDDKVGAASQKEVGR
jgi:hypothetical protein